MSLPSSHPPVLPSLTFHLIPHTHWDREWYLTRAGFQARLIPMLDDVIEQLEREKDARFVLDGQTVLLEDYLAARPERQARLVALIQRGALEIGPWYVLSDLLIPAAASLRRNLMEGIRDARPFGRRLDVLYSPDAFGHPAELPKLAAEFGIRWAVIRRGLGRPGGMDRDLYRWEAPSGEALLVYHLPAGGYDIAIDLGRSGNDLTQLWAPIRRELVDRAVSDQIAVFLGADHHAMAGDVCGLRNRLQALEPGHQVRISGLTEFFTAVERARPVIPVGRGELRRIDGHAWVLQGIHGTRSRLKRRHGQAELVLSRITEPLAMAAGQSGFDRSGLVTLAWRTLLQCQFHDTLAGTTSDAVQREQEVRLDTVDALCREIGSESLRDIARQEPGSSSHRLLLWNPSSRPRTGIMTAELTFFRRDVLVGPPSGRAARTGRGHQPFALVDTSGSVIPVQLLAERCEHDRVDSARHYPDQDEVDRVWVAFVPPAVPGLATASLRTRPRPPALTPKHLELEVRSGFLGNSLVELTVSPVGILSLTDKRTGETYPGLARLEDEVDRGDTYTFSAGPGRTVRGGVELSSRIVAHGPLIGALEAGWAMKSAGAGTILVRLLVVLHADSPLVRLRIDVENQATGHRLRARFPVGAGVVAAAGTAFGVERRPAVIAESDPRAIEQEVRTAPAQRFVAAGEGTRGLAILAPGFFEYEWTARRELAFTLLRSVGALSRNDLPERPGHAAWPEPAPSAEEPGSHRIDLALLAGANLSESADRLEEQWEDAFLPMLSLFQRNDRP